MFVRRAWWDEQPVRGIEEYMAKPLEISTVVAQVVGMAAGMSLT